MKGLVPFNRRNNSLMNTGFEDFYNMLDDYFTPRGFTRDTFKLDVQEAENGYLIEAELPGVKKEEVSLDLEDSRLTISVNREEFVDEKDKNYVHRERRFSSMSRAVYLPDAEREGIKAKLDNGVLTIDVKKEEKSVAPRKIEIE